MKSIQDLREARAEKAKAFRAIAALEKLSPEQRADYERLHAEIGDIDDQMSRINEANRLTAEAALRDETIDRVAGRAHDERSPGLKAFEIFLRRAPAEMTAEEVAALRATMSTTTAAEGGFLVDSEVAARLLVAMKKYGGMRDAATVIRTMTGGTLNFPTADPTNEEGEIVAENATASALDTSFGTIAVPVYKYSSKSVAVPWELLQDNVVDIEAYVIGLLAMRLARIENKHFTTGTGAAQPNGVVTATTFTQAANATSQVTAVLADTLIDVVHYVDPAYRELGNCRWMFNDTTLRNVRKLKDGSNRYLFNPGYELGVPGGAPDTLLGYPISINQQVASMAANAKSILFGDFGFYIIRDVMDLVVRRFDDSAFALKGQVGFCAWQRAGGNLVDVSGAVKGFQNAAS